MEDLEYKKKILDTKSQSFCGAKWYNATIWLGSGMTTSCHHPLPHKIDLEEIKKTCTRALWLENGHLKLDGEVDFVIDSYKQSSLAGGKD